MVHHPERDQIIAKTRALHSELPAFDGSLEKALEQLTKVGEGADLDAARSAARSSVVRYEGELAKNDLLRQLDDSFVGKASIHPWLEVSAASLFVWWLASRAAAQEDASGEPEGSR